MTELPAEPTRICARDDELPTGFHATLPNGITVSVQWHSGAYSSVGREGTDLLSDDATFEVGVWWPIPPGGTRPVWIRIQPHDDVGGWVTRDQLRWLFRELRTLTPGSRECMMPPPPKLGDEPEDDD
jgi:hypothetical protein